jgi:hypothetical protein
MVVQWWSSDGLTVARWWAGGGPAVAYGWVSDGSGWFGGDPVDSRVCLGDGLMVHQFKYEKLKLGK